MKKLSCYFRIVYLFSLIIFLFSSHAYTQENNSNIFLKSHLPDSNATYINEVNNGEFELEQNTEFKIRTSVKTVNTEKIIISKNKDLEINDTLICYDTPVSRSCSFDFRDSPLGMEKHSKLQLSWKEELENISPEIAIETTILQDNKKFTISNIFNKNRLIKSSIEKTVNPAALDLIKKDNTYLAKRELGFKTDDTWRYSYDNKHLVLQSRLDIPAHQSNIIKIYCAKDPDSIMAQFSIDTNGYGGRDDFILYEETKHSIHNKTITIDLRGAYKRKKIDPEKATLQEVILFINTDLNSFKKNPPIENIELCKTEGLSSGRTKGQAITRSGNMVSVEFDLKKTLGIDLKNDAFITGIKINSELNEPQVITGLNARIINSVTENIPSIVFKPEEELKKWIGSDIEKEEYEYVEKFKPLVFQQHYKDPKQPVPLSVFTRKFNNQVDGKVFYYLSGKDNCTIIKGEIKTESNGKEKIVPIYLTKKTGWLDADLSSGTIIKDISIDNTHIPDNETREMQLIIFDVVISPLDSNTGFETNEWYQKEAVFPLVTHKKGFLYNIQNNEGLFFTNKNGKNKITFTLPEKEFLSPVELTIPAKFPDMCRVSLIIDGTEKEILNAPLVIPLTPFKKLEVTIKYFGTKKLIKIPVPAIKVMGLKQTPLDELNKLSITIDDKKLPTDFTGLSLSNNRTNPAAITLDNGTHTIHTEDTEFFNIKTITLETDSPLLYPEPSPVQKPASLIKKLSGTGIKLLIFLIIAALIYFFRNILISFYDCIILLIELFYSILYMSLSDRIWAFFWLLAGIIFYVSGLKTEVVSGENYWFTFGGVFMAVSFLHCMRSVKNVVCKKFPKASTCIYRSTGTVFFSGAILFLILCAFLVLLNLEPLAEQTAIIVYYFLVAGTVCEIIALKSKSKG